MAMAYRDEKLRSAPPGTRHRSNKFAYEPSILPFLRIILVQNRSALMFRSWTLFRSKKYAPFQNGTVIFWTNFHLERSNIPFLRIVHVQNRTVDKLILMLCSWTFYRSRNFAPFSERSVCKRFVQLCIPAYYYRKLCLNIWYSQLFLFLCLVCLCLYF